MKKSLLLLALFFGLMACEDGGLIITVPASSSFDFTISRSVVNSDPDNVFSGSETVDITSFFNEDSEQIRALN